MKKLSRIAQGFISLVILTGLMAVFATFERPIDGSLPRFLCYLALTLMSAGLKVSLPGVTATLSVSFLFILTGIMDLGLPQAIVLGLGSAMTQVFYKAKRTPALYQVAFNLAVVVISVFLADKAFHSPISTLLGGSLPVRLMLATTAYYFLNTFAVACAIALTEHKGATTVWKETYMWAFPYYLLNATIVCVVNWVNQNLGWEFTLFAMPIAWVLHRSYRLYVERLEDDKARAEQERNHVEEMNALHLRTIETLALAIEAKDQTTHQHLCRVQHYALSIGKEMGLSESELNALRAASLLHDIGKLAVPEHIITKPGKLTPQEFEKMKIHPLVGAEILEQVNFPYPVAPIVKAHHEKWNGTGYPMGIAGEEIPIGARILSAVDCLDALASDRQYRRALPLDDAMAVVLGEAGISYDPRVVEILHKSYRQLEMEAQALRPSVAKLSVDAKIERGEAPAAGFELAAVEPTPSDFRSRIAEAGREAQQTMDFVSDLGNSIDMAGMLSVLNSRLTQLIPCDSIALYERKDEALQPVFVDGRDRLLFSSLQIPMGEGLSGWVAEHNKPILNGNPSVEPGYLNDPRKFSVLQSALSIPLEGQDGIVGVLSLYRAKADSFSNDHLRILSGLSGKIGLSLENALKYRALEASATTDYLTGLNNSRALVEALKAEIARSRRQKTPLTVMVCDLDNFKLVNDRYGHQVGNRVLQEFAKGIAEFRGEHDITARFGGDEFVLVVPGIKPETVREEVIALSSLASQVCRMTCGEDLISVSVGIASCPEDGVTVDELLDEADRRMYNTKNIHKQERTISHALHGQAVLLS